jgi:choline-phosphate cytidylyltransferase
MVLTRGMISTSRSKKLGNSSLPSAQKVSVPLALSLSKRRYCSPHGSYLRLCRIVRDYEKYISRQFKRGASRQELNVSWLKKNELDLKRHVTELRDSVRNNWSTTGQELSKELKQYWEMRSRPASPARGGAFDFPRSAGGNLSPGSAGGSSALGHLTHLDIPRPEREGGDFAAGYSLGLIGGIRSWVRPPNPCFLFHVQYIDTSLQMMRSRVSLRSQDSGAPSPENSDEDQDSTGARSPSDEKSPPSRGRTGLRITSTGSDAEETESH